MNFDPDISGGSKERTLGRKWLNSTEAATKCVLQKSFSWIFCIIHRKTPVLESLFNEAPTPHVFM